MKGLSVKLIRWNKQQDAGWARATKEYTGWGTQLWTIFYGPAAVAVSGNISEIR
jgi:hypothetical protein